MEKYPLPHGGHQPETSSTEGSNAFALADLHNIVTALRSEDGCPWDRVQTHESLERCMIEEAYEAVEGIHLLSETGDGENLCEELGDVLLQVVFHSILAEEEKIFTLDDVIQEICRKMIRRHPHVFGSGQAGGTQQNPPSWEEIKAEEKRGKKDQRSELEAVPKAFPALIRAVKVQKKLEKGGYSQPESLETLCRNVQESLGKLEDGSGLSDEMAKAEIGSILYQICRIAGKYGVYPEEALSEKVETEVSGKQPGHVPEL